MTSLTEILLCISILCNVSLIYAAYLFANPLNNKRFQTWILVRAICKRFGNAIHDWKKLPITLTCTDYSKELIKKVEEKLLSKGYKVSNVDNVITIE